MKPAVVTKGIVLARTNYAEADRILTFLTPNHGKVKVIAKGVRKSKSKLAGGIELFSISDISYILGRGEISTLISTRLQKYYGNIVKQVERTNVGYEAIQTINKVTEESPEEGYFNLLRDVYEALDDLGLSQQVTSVWFSMQLLKLTGHAPNLHTDISGEKLDAAKKYLFHYDEMKFGQAGGEGSISANLIKFLRLSLQAQNPQVLNRVEDAPEFVAAAQPIVHSMLKSYVRI